MVRDVIELFIVYLLFRWVVSWFESYNRPTPPPSPPTNIRRQADEPRTEPRKKTDNDDYIDYEEVK